MSLSIPNRKQNFARSKHAREPRQSKHTSKRLQRMAKHVKLSGLDYFDATAEAPAEEDPLHSPEEDPLHSPEEDPLPHPEEFGEYKCDHCQEDFCIDHALVSCCQEGLPTCAAHFLCNSCINTVFEKAMMHNWQYFPARCCPSRDGLRGINIDYCLDRLDRDNWDLCEVSQYQGKLEEYLVMKSTPDLYVLCAVADCGKWLRPSSFQDAVLSSVAKCPVAWCYECDTWTCVSCKSVYEDGHHRCDSSEDPSRKPSWLPEYSDECRIKPCPRCHLWIELHEACNHMTCEHCRHQFCFVCMMTWDGGHNGCPQYGDRAGGYDADGYEMNDRGLHLYTGLDRSGRNRVGSVITQQSQNAHQGGAPAYDDHDHEEDGTQYDDQYDDDYEENHAGYFNEDYDENYDGGWGDPGLQQDEQIPNEQDEQDDAHDDAHLNIIDQHEDHLSLDGVVGVTEWLTNDMTHQAFANVIENVVEEVPDAVREDDHHHEDGEREQHAMLVEQPERSEQENLSLSDDLVEPAEANQDILPGELVHGIATSERVSPGVDEETTVAEGNNNRIFEDESAGPRASDGNENTGHILEDRESEQNQPGPEQATETVVSQGTSNAVDPTPEPETDS